MILTIKDRLLLRSVLPEQGNLISMILAKSIAKKLDFTPKEITDFCIKQEGEKITWDSSKCVDIEVSFEESEINLLRDQFKKLDSEEKISIDMVDLYEKVISTWSIYMEK